MRTFSILRAFIRLAFSDPKLTLRLLSPARIGNAFLLFFKHPGELQHVLKNYKSIYSVTGDKLSKEILEICRATDSLADIFVFPVIDWHYRHQRPQHIVSGLGRLGYRVFYIATSPLMDSTDNSFLVTERPAEGVFLCKLRGATENFSNLHQREMSNSDRDALFTSLQALMHAANVVRPPAIILNHPYWLPLLRKIEARSVIYDCMDHHAGFLDNDNNWLNGEIELLEAADHVVTSSMWLHDHVGAIRTSTLVRNGCEFSRFSHEPDVFQSERPVVGYVGAISHWFDIELVVAAAREFPEWEFVLVGSTMDCDTGAAETVQNIQFIGEVDYERVPIFVRGFDVCIIPFRMNKLTEATNPVKVYEYLAAGKPVVSSSFPEARLLDGLIYVADSAPRFLSQLKLAMAESKNRRLAEQRTEWAKNQDWSLRIEVFDDILKKTKIH